MNLNITIIAGILGAAVGFGTGRHTANNVCEKRELVAAAVAKEKYDEIASQYHAASASFEALQAKRGAATRTVVREVDRIVDRPVYAGTCLDDDGLRVVNEALTGGKP